MSVLSFVNPLMSVNSDLSQPSKYFFEQQEHVIGEQEVATDLAKTEIFKISLLKKSEPIKELLGISLLLLKIFLKFYPNYYTFHQPTYSLKVI
ncbi:29048_t:CDS:2 [Gigaspora margarita]|uniref:29048_t:CDS:1 n=1 Tax=Gigaspora margarita TaxID=4874 RepID=A0ABM8VW16_GIGMA|nr:29048_t:CDS:2 [Gigaspora margarita]